MQPGDRRADILNQGRIQPRVVVSIAFGKHRDTARGAPSSSVV